MNNSNPLIPQGSMLEQNQGRARFKFAVFFGIALHILFVGGLLMVGCKKDQGEQAQGEQSTTGLSAEQDTNFLANVVDTNVPSTTVASNEPHLAVPSQPTQPVQPTQPTLPPEVAPPVPGPVQGGSATEYVVTKGDSFSTIAKKMGVSVRAIQEANPTVVPTKLKVGQKLQIPAPTSSATHTVSGGISTQADTTGGARTYTVKSGDSLSKIAKNQGVSIKALRAANNLRTDRIKVGDKLKIPATGSAAPSAPVETPAPLDNSVPPATSGVPTLPPPAPGR